MDTLERYARRLRHHPAFMGYVLWLVMAAEDMDEDGLARQLGLGPQGLARLALCRRPRPEHFSADVQAIADFTGADPAELRRVLEVFETLQDK